MCLGLGLFGSNLFVVLQASWTCVSFSYTRLLKFLVIISSNGFSSPCSLSPPSGILLMWSSWFWTIADIEEREENRKRERSHCLFPHLSSCWATGFSPKTLELLLVSSFPVATRLTGLAPQGLWDSSPFHLLLALWSSPCLIVFLPARL